MKYLGYYNGTYGPLEEMMIPMNDRVCYFGDGVYDATLARNGKIFALDAHLDRFYNSAGLLKMEVPYSREELAEILKSLLKEMDRLGDFRLLAADKRNGHPDPLLPGAAFQTKSLDHAEAGFPGRTVKNHETHHPGRYQIPSLQYQNTEPDSQRSWAIRKPTRPAVTNVYSTGATS